MELQEKKYQYAEKKEQIKRANRFLTLGFLLFYLAMTIVVWIAAIRGIRTMGYAITIEGIVIAALAITKIYDVKNPGSVYTKYIALVGVVIVACITGFEFDAYYVRFMAAIPCISAVLFFDNKYTKIAGSLFMAINIFLNVYKIAIIKKFSGEAAAGAVSKSVEAAEAQDGLISQASESFTEVNSNVGQLISDIGEIDHMLSDLSEANNQIVDNIMHLSATTQEVTASSAQAAELSVRNLHNAEQTKNLLDGVIATSHQLDQYTAK